MTEIQLWIVFRKKKNTLAHIIRLVQGVHLASGMAGSRGLLMSGQHILSMSQLSFLFAGFILKWKTGWPPAVASLYPINLATPTKCECLFPLNCCKVPRGNLSVQHRLHACFYSGAGGGGPLFLPPDASTVARPSGTGPTLVQGPRLLFCGVTGFAC